VDYVAQTYDIMVGVIRPSVSLDDDLHREINEAYGLCAFAYDGMLVYEEGKTKVVYSS